MSVLIFLLFYFFDPLLLIRYIACVVSRSLNQPSKLLLNSYVIYDKILY